MLNIKIKKILMFFMLIILVFSLSACGKINATTITNDDGTVEERITIVLDSEIILEKLNYQDLENLKLDIYLQSKLEIKNMINKFNNTLIVDLKEANLLKDVDKIEMLNNYKNGMEEIEPVWNENVLTAGVKYRNANIYKYYYNVPNDSTSEPIIEEHFFYNKEIYKGYSMYVRHFDLYERMNSYYSLYYSEFVDDEKINLTYTYTTDLRRQHSNADSIEFIDGKYYHTWNIDKNNLEKLKTGEIDYEVTLYFNIANKANCIMVCLAVTFAVTLIFLFVGIIILKSHKKRKINQINK